MTQDQIAARLVEIDYTNHRGERRRRVIIPHAIGFGGCPWHEGPQWLMTAEDFEKRELRTFALKDIHSWKTLKPPG